MEDKFYNDGFEEFLREQVKDSRMYPSDGLWRKIYKEVHGDTNWPALTIAAFCFLAAIIAISVYFTPFPGIDERTIAISANPHTKPNRQLKSEPGDLVAATTRKNQKRLQTIPFVEGEGSGDMDLAEAVVQKTLVEQQTVAQPSRKTTETEPLLNTENTPGRIIFMHSATPVVNSVSDRLYEVPPVVENGRSSEALHLNAAPETEKPVEDALENTAAEINDGAEEEANTAFGDDYLTRPVQEPGFSPVPKTGSKGKFSYTVYITASNSYRKLIENEILRTGGKPGPVALNTLVDINKVVRHKPGTGIEAGVSFLYNITDKLKATAGLQFNIRQYSMEAYMATTEVATIGLINRNGGIDSVGTYAVYRNTNGYRPTELVNRYYQASIPLGLQWQVLGNNILQLHVAASVQPTYFLNRDTYLISTDYQNYTQNPDIIRQWNVNAGLETFVSFKSGDFRWQLGPQVRYQNLPTLIKAYPIREYLVDYGVKLGVTKKIH